MSVNNENFDKNSNEETNEFINDQDKQENEMQNNNSQSVKESENSQLKRELASQKDKYIRLMAEFENYKRRTSSERVDLIQTAGKDILSSFLEILDDMDRAEVQIDKDQNIDHIKQGVQLVFNKFRNLMSSKGIKAIESQGQDFDTEQHEAVANVPVQKTEQKGKVIDEVQKGYKLNDKIIRFPKVVVGQ